MQGFAAALGELRYDPDTGQLVTGSMLDFFADRHGRPADRAAGPEVGSPVTTFGARGVGDGKR